MIGLGLFLIGGEGILSLIGHDLGPNKDSAKHKETGKTKIYY